MTVPNICKELVPEFTENDRQPHLALRVFVCDNVLSHTHTVEIDRHLDEERPFRRLWAASTTSIIFSTHKKEDL
jgi:hypothetical protein